MLFLSWTPRSNGHVTQIHRSFLTKPNKNKDILKHFLKIRMAAEVKQTSWRQKWRCWWGIAWEKNTGSWHPKRQRAILWHRGSGMGDWEDSYLQNRCLANFDFNIDASKSSRYLQRLCAINTELTAYKIRKRNTFVFFFDSFQMKKEAAAENSLAHSRGRWIHV